MPFEMHDLLNPLNNSFDFMCRFHKFVKFSADLSSGCIIVCISFDRFMRIARPHRGFSLPHAKLAVICVSLGTVLMCSLSLYVYGSQTVIIESHPGLTGSRCGINDQSKQTVVPLLFHTTILLWFGIGVAILFMVYIRLGIKVKKWNKGRKDVKQERQSTLYSHGLPSRDESSSRVETPDWQTDNSKQVEMFTFPSVVFEEGEPIGEGEMEDDIQSPRTQVSFRADFVRQISRSMDEVHMENLEMPNASKVTSRDIAKNNNIPNFKFENTHQNGTRTLPLPRSSKLSVKPTVKNVRRKSSMMTLNDLKRRMHLTKTTVMFMIATIAFVASHLPYVCATIVMMVHPRAMDSMSAAGVSLWRIAEHSYIISYAANPIIYSFMNPKFRTECKTLMIKVIQKLKCRSKSFDLRE